MADKTFRQPNHEAMQRLLSRHAHDATGIVLRLAWREGLTRDEIRSLTWEQVDFDESLLRLRDREIPLEEETAARLRERQALYGESSPYVTISERRRSPFSAQSLSRLARLAMDEEGQHEIRLEDLRFDFIKRQLERYDWPYAIYISGVSVTTYRNTLAQLSHSAGAASPMPQNSDDGEFRLWKVLQAEKASSAGIALWLSTQLGLYIHEIVALTWDQVDFSANVIRLSEREVPLSRAVSTILRDEMERRAPEDDPHVILTPRSRKPTTAERLSTMVRSILIRGGVDHQSLRYLRKNTAKADERTALERYAIENGSVSRNEAMELLGISGNVAYDRLSSLTRDGVLVRINTRYYPVGSVVAPEKQAEAIRAYLEQWDTAYCKDIADMLHIGKRTTARILKRMVDDGEIVLLRREKRYKLPG